MARDPERITRAFCGAAVVGASALLLISAAPAPARPSPPTTVCSILGEAYCNNHPSLAAPDRLKFVIIDPGHGGHDSGAVGVDGLLEKDLTLSAGLALSAELSVRGYQVLMTRGRDQFVSLDDRAKMFGSVGADLFISLHADTSGNSERRGLAVYVHDSLGDDVNPSNSAPDGTSKESYAFAHAVLDGLPVDFPILERGLRRANFKVLRESLAPSALIEMGFMSNEHDAANMGSPTQVANLARSLADATDMYFADNGAAIAETPPAASPVHNNLLVTGQKPASAATSKRGIVLRAGAFRTKAYAERRAEALAQFGTVTVTASASAGGPLYLVQVGPFTRTIDAQASLERVRAIEPAVYLDMPAS